jgi:hypothetical protein
MAIDQGLTTSFKEQILLGQHDLDTDTLKMALYTGFATLNYATTVYTPANEAVGAGYTAGGEIITGVTVTSQGLTAYVNFAPVSWNAAITARGALIYNASKANKSVAVINFGADKTSTSIFLVTPPANTATTAIIRLP